jgi:hypothetical protein
MPRQLKAAERKRVLEDLRLALDFACRDHITRSDRDDARDYMAASEQTVEFSIGHVRATLQGVISILEGGERFSAIDAPDSRTATRSANRWLRRLDGRVFASQKLIISGADTE